MDQNVDVFSSLSSSFAIKDKISLMWDWDKAFRLVSSSLKLELLSISGACCITSRSLSLDIPRCPKNYIDIEIPGGDFNLIFFGIASDDCKMNFNYAECGLVEISTDIPRSENNDDCLIFFRKKLTISTFDQQYIYIYSCEKSVRENSPAALEVWAELHSDGVKHRLNESEIEVMKYTDSMFWTRRKIAVNEDLRRKVRASDALGFIFIRLRNIYEPLHLGPFAFI